MVRRSENTLFSLKCSESRIGKQFTVFFYLRDTDSWGGQMMIQQSSCLPKAGWTGILLASSLIDILVSNSIQFGVIASNRVKIVAMPIYLSFFALLNE